MSAHAHNDAIYNEGEAKWNKASQTLLEEVSGAQFSNNRWVHGAVRRGREYTKTGCNDDDDSPNP